MARLCQCETSVGKRYVRCTNQATRVSAWGWYYCEEHRGGQDQMISELVRLGAKLPPYDASTGERREGAQFPEARD